MSKIPRERIDDDLSLVLRAIYHFERNLTEQFGLDYQEIYALQYLRRCPSLRLTEIARELNVPMFKASRLVDRLAGQSLVEKLKGDKDRRSLSVSLLPAGEKVVVEIEASSYQRISENTRNMTDNEVLQLMHLAEQLHQYLGVSERVIK